MRGLLYSCEWKRERGDVPWGWGGGGVGLAAGVAPPGGAGVVAELFPSGRAARFRRLRWRDDPRLWRGTAWWECMVLL